MKRIVSVFVFVLAVSCAACGGPADTSDVDGAVPCTGGVAVFEGEAPALYYQYYDQPAIETTRPVRYTQWYLFASASDGWTEVVCNESWMVVAQGRE